MKWEGEASINQSKIPAIYLETAFLAQVKILYRKLAVIWESELQRRDGKASFFNDMLEKTNKILYIARPFFEARQARCFPTVNTPMILRPSRRWFSRNQASP